MPSHETLPGNPAGSTVSRRRGGLRVFWALLLSASEVAVKIHYDAPWR